MRAAEHPQCEYLAVGVIERLSEAKTFLAVGDPFLEPSPVGENPSQKTAGDHRRKSGEAKSFPAPIAFKQLQDFQEKILGPWIVAQVEAGRAKVEASRHLERNIPQRLGDGLGALAERERLAQMTSHAEVVAQMDGHLAQSPLIVERLGQAFGLAEIAEFEFSEREERVLRSKRRSMACSCLSRVSGSASRSCSARSKELTASRLADRALASRPALSQ